MVMSSSVIPSHSEPGRRGFTMVELLVVISIIAVLSGLLIPATGMIQRQMNSAKCSNHLRQIGTGIMAYQAEQAGGANLFPTRMSDLFDPALGYPLAGETTKILICPDDGAAGKSGSSNRHPSWPDYDYLVSNEPYPTSYFYETSGDPILNGKTGLVEMWAGSHASWAEYKRWQKRLGNSDGDQNGDGKIDGADDMDGDGVAPDNRRPFPGDFLPIVRCYWHHPWTGTSKDYGIKRVNNVSWNGSVFKSTPYWENDVNSKIPLP